MNWETLLCLGDSITIGSRSYLGYPEYCGAFLSEETKKNWNVINHSVAGFNTVDLTRSIDKCFVNLKNSRPDIVTVMIGTNDLKCGTSMTNFKMIFQQLVTKMRLIVGNNNVVLIDIPKLNNGVMLPYNVGMNGLIEEYNSIIKEIAKNDHLIHMSFKCEESFFFDGIHFNEYGSEQIGRQLARQILQLRGI